MRVLITGGAGFIGSHLAQALLGEGNELCIIDNLNDFYPPAMKRANLEEIRKSGSFEFECLDICDEAAVLQAVQRFSPDTIVHLAARAGVRPSLENPLLYEETNIRGTMVLLEAARRTGARKFVFASSSSIYGASSRVPFSEEDSANMPISPYAATKLAGEKICYTYSHLHPLNVICLRLFTVYGPRQRPDLAIRKFAERIDRGQPIPMYGDGSAARDYTFVGDTVTGILAAIEYDCDYEIFNLGNSHPIELRALVSALESAMGKKAIIERLPDQPGDVPITFADISKARRLLSYQPATPLSVGLRMFVSWYRHGRPAMAA